MSEQQLINEFNDGGRMFGCNHNNKLVGVIGIQKVKDAILIRHAYILTSHQGEGVGSLLLKYLLEKNKNSRLLVGTWQKAIWAIQFYEKYDFVLQTKKQTNELLKKYWKISPKQIENSLILIFAFIGIFVCLIKKNVYSYLFLLFIFFITLFPPFLSETNNNVFYETSTSLTIHRVLFSIQFICLISIY